MDTVFIKMMEKAEEIQKGHKWQAWDYCHCEITKKVVVVSGYETDAGCYGHEIPSYPFEDRGIIGTWVEHGGCDGEGKHIWLPTQAQLQEMVRGDNTVDLMVDRFFEYFTLNWSCLSSFWWKESSFEQLWLAFVMKEKYQKIWDGNDWIKESI